MLKQTIEKEFIMENLTNNEVLKNLQNAIGMIYKGWDLVVTVDDYFITVEYGNEICCIERTYESYNTHETALLDRIDQMLFGK